MSESLIQRDIRLALGQEPDCRLFRNNVGAAWQGQPVGAVNRRRVVLLCPHRVVYGLAPGSSDLIGWRSVLVPPELVGRRIAIFTALEIKPPGETVPDHQGRFLDRAAAAGAIAGVAHSPAEARRLLGLP
jgi:hypothetical protein